MAQELLDALPKEAVLQANSLATVTRSCVLLRGSDAKSQMILSITSVSTMHRVKTTYPGLLVIAAGLGLIAAGAYYSKDSRGSSIPIAVISLIFLVLYFGSRRAAIAFSVGAETIETTSGTFREAAALMKAVEKAKSMFDNAS